MLINFHYNQPHSYVATEKIGLNDDIDVWKELALADTLTRENGLHRVTITDPRHEVIIWDTEQVLLRGLSKGDGIYKNVLLISVDDLT